MFYTKTEWLVFLSQYILWSSRARKQVTEYGGWYSILSIVMLKKEHVKILGHKQKFHFSAHKLKRNFFSKVVFIITESTKHQSTVIVISAVAIGSNNCNMAMNGTSSWYSLQFPPQLFNYTEIRIWGWPDFRKLHIFIHKKSFCCMLCVAVYHCAEKCLLIFWQKIRQ